MASTTAGGNSCPGCGAANDPLNTTCSYCRAGLPNSGVDRMTNEDLVMHTTEWVGKAKEIRVVVRSPDFNALTHRGVCVLTNAEIVLMAEKYLAVMGMRKSTSRELEKIYHDLTNSLAQNKATFAEKQKKAAGCATPTVLLMMCVCIAIIMLV